MLKSPISEAVENLRDALAANLNWEVNFLDIKYLNDMEQEYREEVKKQIALYRSWQRTAAQQRDVRVIIFTNLRGKALRESIDGNIAIWKTVRAERKFLTDVYVDQLRGSKKH